MALIRMSIGEQATVTDSVRPPAVHPTEAFRVLRPVFKQGREWAPGETIRLNPETGARFVASGDMEGPIDD